MGYSPYDCEVRLAEQLTFLLSLEELGRVCTQDFGPIPSTFPASSADSEPCPRNLDLTILWVYLQGLMEVRATSGTKRHKLKMFVYHSIIPSRGNALPPA